MNHFTYTHTEHPGFLISTDPSKLDLDFVHQFLSEESYWAEGADMEEVEDAIEGTLCYGIYENNKQVGFANITTDFSSFGYISDVLIKESYRGKGLSLWLMECILAHPDLKVLPELLLMTDDAHGLYERFGFKRVPGSKDQMIRVNP